MIPTRCFTRGGRRTHYTVGTGLTLCGWRAVPYEGIVKGRHGSIRSPGS